MTTMHKLRILGLSILMLAGISIHEKVNAQPGISISFQTFYNELAPYGRWINNPQYGSVWSPYVDAGFQPYATNGYWEVTDYGNTWVSDYDWGWAPFHYGRWSYDDYNGWFWVPGYEWGPAWVNWRSGGGYYGWAPLGPGVNVNISVNIPSFWWVFVPQQYISSRSWHNFWVPRNRYNSIYGHTTIINNYYRNNNRTYVYGPRRDEIQRVTGRSVTIREIDRGRRGVVMVDRGRGYNNYGSDRSRAYNAPDRTPDRGNFRGNDSRNGAYNNPGSRGDYNSGNRAINERGYNTNPGNRGGYGNDQPNRSNERSNPSGRYSSPSDRGSQDYSSQREQGSFRTGGERPTPNVDQNRSRSYEPSGNTGGRSGNYGAGQRQERPSYSAPERSHASERSTGGGQNNGRSGDNGGNGSRSERGGGRSPR